MHRNTTVSNNGAHFCPIIIFIIILEISEKFYNFYKNEKDIVFLLLYIYVYIYITFLILLIGKNFSFDWTSIKNKSSTYNFII